MTHDPDRPADGTPANPVAPAAKTPEMTPEKTPAKPAPRNGFDPAALKGGHHPGGKMVRGTRNVQSGKSRSR